MYETPQKIKIKLIAAYAVRSPAHTQTGHTTLSCAPLKCESYMWCAGRICSISDSRLVTGRASRCRRAMFN